MSRVFQKGVSLLRTKSRHSEGAVSTPDRLGRTNLFRGLVANLGGLETKKSPVGRVALGNWLACYRVSTRMGIFT